MPYPSTPGCQTIANPCQTFNYALSQTLPGGEVIAVASGAYAPATITHSVTIEAAPGVYAGITPVGSGAGVTVNGIAGTIVVLRGLTIQGGSGDGIDFNSGAALHVENCVINGMGSNGIADSSSGNLFVKDTVIRNCGTFGVQLYGSSAAHASLSHVWLENDLTGLLVNYGVTSISNSVISGNTNDGIGAGASAEVNVESCQIANNGRNGIGIVSGTIRVSNSTVTDNTKYGLYQNGGTLYSRQNNTVAGNVGGDTSGTITPLPAT